MATLNFTCQMLQGSLYAQLAQNTVASDGWRYTNRMAALGCAVLAAPVLGLSPVNCASTGSLLAALGASPTRRPLAWRSRSDGY